MQPLGPCRVVGVSCENPDTMDVHEVGGRMRTIVTGPARVDVEVEIPLTGFGEHQRLSEIYSKGEDVEVAGLPFRITSFAWRADTADAGRLDLTLHGRGEASRITSALRQLGPGAVMVPDPQVVQQATDELVKEQDEEAAQMAATNRALGTLDDLT